MMLEQRHRRAGTHWRPIQASKVGRPPTARGVAVGARALPATGVLEHHGVRVVLTT
jgi:hypothetical protein